MGVGAAYYRGIRGSAAIATSRVDPRAVPPETLAPGEMRRVPFAGELLGAVRVRAGFAALPLDAFDRVGEVLEAEEQAAYLQLLRLAWGEGRNHCRAGKRELMARLRVSERRLNRILDALVSRGFAKPLHRDNRGTLWRVYLPAEAFGEAVGDEVLLGRAAPVAVRGPAPEPPPARASAPEAPRAAAASPLALARALAAARGGDDAAAVAEAAREIRELLDEGQTPARILACIDAVRRRAARAEPKGAP